MNERIAELLAKLDIDLYTDEGVMMTKILVSPKYLRQFAELIVRECMGLCYRIDTEYEGKKVKPTVIASKVAEHFGVEE